MTPSALFLGFLTSEDGCAHGGSAKSPEGLPRQRAHAPVGQGQARPLVLDAGREGGQDLPSDPARPGAMARVPGAVADARAGCGSEEGNVIGRDVDGATPRMLERDVDEGGQEAPEAPGRAADRGDIVREPRIDPASGSDRARAASHQYPPVVRRSEIVEEHAAVADRFAAGPADLLQKLGYRFGQDDVAAEVREPPCHGA